MKTVIITGASGGIGKAVCETFHEAGYKVIGIDRTAPNSETPYLVLQYDISRCHMENCDDFFIKLENLCDNGELHVLVNNAAVQIVKPIEEIVSQDWNQTLQTNLLAPFWLIQRFLPMLRKARGNVVNVASIHAHVTKANFSTYATSKGALLTMTKALSLEIAPEVRINAIIPAATDTPMLREGFDGNEDAMNELGKYHPLGRIAKAREIAESILFLASDKASFITGSALNVDGGIGAALHDPIIAR